MKTPEQDYDAEWEAMQPYESCPTCGRDYDDIGFDYQYCKKCGWDAEKGQFDKSMEPTEDDYLNGDADILTGEWF